MKHPYHYFLAVTGVLTIAAFVAMVGILAFYAIEGDWFAACTLVCLIGSVAALMWPGKPFSNPSDLPSDRWKNRNQ
jgi:hypothetical protein